jgi:hypothetical protein
MLVMASRAITRHAAPSSSSRGSSHRRIHVFAQTKTPPVRRSRIVDQLERRYLALHEGDREAAARNLAVDLMTVEVKSLDAGPAPDAATLRRFQRAAITACGVLRLPMGHAMTVYSDTVEYAREHLLPGAPGHGGTPITRWEAAALTTRRAA